MERKYSSSEVDDDFVLIENSSNIPVKEHRIEIPAEQQPSSPPRRRFPPSLSTVPDVSAATHHRTTPPRRRIKLSTISCSIPILVLLCFFLLWWFSSPVKVVVKDGRLMDVDVDTTQNLSASLKNAHISLKGLLVRSPIPSLTMPDKTEDA